jgi:osmotically-inducible protein OsmY
MNKINGRGGGVFERGRESMYRVRIENDKAKRRAIRSAFRWGVGLGALTGVAATFFGDRRLGRKRRAMAADKISHASRVGREEVAKTKRNLGNHVRGWFAELQGRIRAAPADDDVIEQRVRAALGRASSHVSAIDVAVKEGMVVLGGPLLEHEHRNVVRTALRVRGVRGVDDRLKLHQQADIGILGGARS